MSFSILSLATSSPSAGKGEPRPRVIDIERDSAKLCNLPLGADISINNTSTLGREALVAALSKIGIDQSQIGMVIGDNCAPHQTTPSEAQRVAGKFDLRVPAFDISVGGCALLAMLESLSHMRTDALPDYIALVSSNSPTLRLHSKASSVELCVSDGSGVAIVSPRITSPIRIVEAHYGPSHLSHRLDTNGPGITIETAGFLTICEEFPGVVKEIVRRQTAAALEKCVMPLDRVKFIGGCFTDSDNLEIAESLRISSSNVLPGVESHGYSFGSLPFMILNSAWSELKQGDTLVISLAGAAYDAGFLILQVMEE